VVKGRGKEGKGREEEGGKGKEMEERLPPLRFKSG